MVFSFVQANYSFDTVYAANSICSSTIAFQASLTVDNGQSVGYNGAYDALGASVVGYESTLLQVSILVLRESKTKMVTLFLREVEIISSSRTTHLPMHLSGSIHTMPV